MWRSYLSHLECTACGLQHAAQVAGVEQASVPGFDLQSISIESGMIDEMRCDGERSILVGMDVVAIVLGIAMFAILLFIIEGIDRI